MIATVVAGGLSTVQDGGRSGLEDVGVPAAGAWNRGRYEALARLLHGTPDARLPAIELLAGTMRLRMEAAVDVAVVGPADVHVDGRPAPAHAVLAVARSELSVRALGRGPVYVGLSGWSPPRVLGSCSTDTFSGIGGAPLAGGDVLAGLPTSTGRVGWFLRPEPDEGGRVGIVPLHGELVVPFCGQSWQVTATARSGTRLRAAAWRAPRESIDSIPVLPGAVQMTPDGEAIVLGNDGALTGGYPVVGVLATAALDAISLLSVGEFVRFTPVDVESAASAYRRALMSRSRRVVDPTRLS